MADDYESDEDIHPSRIYFPETIYCTECNRDGSRGKCILEGEIISYIDKCLQESENCVFKNENYAYARDVIYFTREHLQCGEIPYCVAIKICDSFLYKDQYSDYTILRTIFGFTICDHCNQRPCDFHGLFPILWRFYIDHSASAPLLNLSKKYRRINRDCRQEMYRLALNYVHGPIEDTVWSELPRCAVAMIKWLAPDEEGEYISSDESDNEDEYNDRDYYSEAENSYDIM